MRCLPCCASKRFVILNIVIIPQHRFHFQYHSHSQHYRHSQYHSHSQLPISFIHHVPNIFSLCFVKKVNCRNLDSRLFVQLWEFNQPSVLSRKTCWTWRAKLSEFYKDSLKNDSWKKNGYKFRIARNSCRILHGSFQVLNATGG